MKIDMWIERKMKIDREIGKRHDEHEYEAQEENVDMRIAMRMQMR